MSGDSKRSHDGIASISETELDSALLDIQQRYKSSTTPKELQHLIEHIDKETAKLDHDMKQFVTLKSKKHDQELSSLEFKRATKLAGTIVNSNDLSQIFQTANDLGHSLTLKIKSLDSEIANVNQTLEFVQDIQNLKTNINKAHYALEHGDLEVTARCIHNINSTISPELINGQYASVVIPSTDIPDLPETILTKWSNDLTKVFSTKFNEAAKERNVPELTKYFQLFPLINQSETGLNHYSKFICDIISETSNHLIGSTSSVNPSDLKSGVFSNLTISLFESITTMLSQHESLIKRYYSKSFPTCMSYVITRIQDEIDSQIGVISDTFYDLRRIDKLFQDIQLYKFPILTRRREEQTNELQNASTGLANEPSLQYYDDEVISIVQVGDLINELATIFHHWSLYSKFISARYLQDPVPAKKNGSAIESKSKLGHRRLESNGNTHYELKLPQLIIDSNFTRKINQKLLPTFEMLYKFYFRRSLEKSIVIEELPSLDPYLQVISNSSTTSFTNLNDEHSPCSSVIEDVTLILNTTLRNIIQTSILSTVKTFVTGTSKTLQNDLINGYFIKNLNENMPRYNQTLSLISSTTSNSGISRAASPVTRSATPEVNGGMSFFKGASSAIGNVVGGTSGAANVAVGGLRTGVNNPKLVNFIIHLNTVSLGQEYFSKIITNILKASNLIASAFPFSGDAEKVEAWLKEDLLDPFVSRTNKILNDSLINLYNQSLRIRLNNMVNELIPDASETYLVHSNDDINDTQALIRFGVAWQSLMTPLKQSVHNPLFEKLMRLVVVNIVNLLEKRLHVILKKFRINELGSVRLEKDISYFINEVCDDNYQLREKFVRITQLVLLVDMDDDEYEESLRHANQAKTGESSENGKSEAAADEDEYDDDYHLGINWVLTPSERKQIRSYRI